MASGIPASCVFQHSVWSDFFLTYKPRPPKRSMEWMKVRTAKLKKDIRLSFETRSKGVERMKLVDEIQRLGIEHLFEQQIDATLSDIHGSEFSSSSLHEVALRFRLLREHGLWVSPDVFKKFMGENGSFKDDTTAEPNGLLCLYNAAYTFTHKELELEEAISFARLHLESLAPNLAFPLAEQVKRSLLVPLPRTYKRLEALRYMPEYEHEEGHNPVLLELAKLEFNILQLSHLKELKAVSKWFSNILGDVEISNVRNRVVECYLWGYTAFYEEDFALARMILVKLTILHTLLDDISDVIATLEDYRKLDMAIQRWDESAISLVPKYLQKFYSKLLSCVREIEDELTINGKYDIARMKKELQDHSGFYLQEAEWLHQNHKPSYSDSLELGLKSVGGLAAGVYIIILMGDALPNGVLEWAAGYPDALTAGAKIARLMNDIAATSKGRQNTGDVANCVECYMSEHNVTAEAAIAVIESLIEDEWKTINQARLEQGRELLPVLQRIVNMILSLPLYYGERRDAFTFCTHLDDIIKSLFVEPVPIQKSISF